MKYPTPLEPAVLIKRYKRFLADVSLPGGEVETIYCPNTGSMKHCADPGVPIWFSRTDNPKRKYQLTWEQGTDSWGNRVGLRSVLANTLIDEAIDGGVLADAERQSMLAAGLSDAWLSDIRRVQAEWAWERERVRFDFAIETGASDVLVEVKSVTLAQVDGLGLFPDAKTARGLKQVKALRLAQREGKRAMLVYCVQNTGVTRVGLAESIDPAYAQAVRALRDEGGRILALGCDVNAQGIRAVRPLPVILDG